MKLKRLFPLFAILVLACGLLPSEPAATEVIVPTAAPQQPTSAPTAVPQASEPVLSDPDFFRDDFNEELGDGWTWTREDPNDWTLTAVPGSLQINAGPGHIYDETVTNLLLREAPSGDFQIETRVTFTPASDFQFAGLIIIESASTLLQAGRAFCGLDTCVGDGLYLDYYLNGEFIMPNYAFPYTESDRVYLRLIRQAGTITLQTSSDGSEWILRGGQVSDMTPVQIGLTAGQSTSVIIPALFDYFQVSSVP